MNARLPAHARLAWLLLTLAALCLGVALVAGGARAQAPGSCLDSPAEIRAGKGSFNLGRCFHYLQDEAHEYSLQEVIAGRTPDFNEHTVGVLNYGYTESVFWVKRDLVLRRGNQPAADWVLELMLPLVDQADLFLVDERGEIVAEHRHRYAEDWSEREFAVPNPAFRLDLEPGKRYSLILRVETRNTMRLPLNLWELESFLAKVSVDEWIQGLFMGALFALFAYNFFVTLVVREPGYIYYTTYILFAMLFVMTEQVHGIQVFGGLQPWFHKEYLQFYIQLSWIFGTMMARELLDTRNRAAHLDQVLKLCLYAAITTLVLSLFQDYHLAMEWTVIGSVGLAVVIIALSYWAWRNELPSSGIYFVSWLCTLGGVFFYGTAVMGYYPLNSFTSHAPQLGFVAQNILLSLAFANRIKIVQREALEWNQQAVANLRRYRALFQNAMEGIFQMSTRCRFLDANPSMARILGYSSVDELIQGVPDALEACFSQASVRYWVIRQLEKEGEVHGVEAAFETRHGEERWANISIRTIYNDEGEPSHLEGTCVDVTERRQRQEIEKERENERLEKEIARNSAAAKSQFLANMSHEIRTPLAAIIGYGETLMEPDLNESEKRSSAETVVRSGRHLLDLINDILDHSKIDANKLEVERLEVNLPELLDEVRAFFTPRAREKGVSFFIQCEYPLPEVIQTDPTRFRQILINLCGNALKFTEKGSIHIAIRCDPEQETLYAKVVDTGMGMKPEQMERLFDPFAQGSAATARQYGGTGLGLSISRHLAGLLGGDITVDSVYGEGSEFEVTIDSGSLEGVHMVRDASEMTQRRRQLPMLHAPHLSGRILVAEDNEVNRQLVDLLIRRTGAEVAHVGNGAEALERATRESWDLILMDIQMPVMNGRDATSAIRDAGFKTPIVALTANVMAEDLQDYQEAGCDDFLAKPIDKRRFYEVLGRYLMVRSEARGEAAQHHGTVLVAEDNKDNSRLVERLLRRFGATVLTVDTGSAAVSTAMGETVHMVLMDSHMPEMDGPEATRMLRQTGFRRPIIAFTAGDEAEVDALREAGCEGVLHKPIDSEQLRMLLQKHLGASESGDAAQDPSMDLDVQHLVDQFLDGLPERLNIMDQAIREEHWTELQRQVHQIKGTAGAVGYPLITEKAFEVERALKNQEMTHAANVYPELAALIRQALEGRE
ncbi:response regulator [Halomonadaceae bacterium KBTZ08]